MTGSSAEGGSGEAATGADTTAGQAAFAKTVGALAAAAAADPTTPEGEAQQKALETLGLTAEDAQALAAYAKTLSEAEPPPENCRRPCRHLWHLWRPEVNS